MESTAVAGSPLANDATFVCPNCGATQRVAGGVDARCDRCGTLVTPNTTGEEGIVGAPGVGTSDPVNVAPPMTGGGIGGVNDGTQVVMRPGTAIPGKPMPSNASGMEGGDLAGNHGDTSASSPHAARGGSG